MERESTSWLIAGLGALVLGLNSLGASPDPNATAFGAVALGCGLLAALRR